MERWERERERASASASTSVYWLTSQMATVVGAKSGAGPGQSHELGPPFGFSTWVTGAQILRPSSAFSGTLVRGWIRSSTWDLNLHAHVLKCQAHKQCLTQYYNTGPGLFHDVSILSHFVCFSSLLQHLARLSHYIFHITYSLSHIWFFLSSLTTKTAPFSGALLKILFMFIIKTIFYKNTSISVSALLVEKWAPVIWELVCR